MHRVFVGFVMASSRHTSEQEFPVMDIEASKIWWLANNEPQSFRCKSACQSNCAGESGLSVTHLHKCIHWFKVFEHRMTG